MSLPALAAGTRRSGASRSARGSETSAHPSSPELTMLTGPAPTRARQLWIASALSRRALHPAPDVRCQPLSSAMRSIIRFESGSDICSAILRASSARSCQCSGLSRMELDTACVHSAAVQGERYWRGRRWTSWIAAMPTPKECRQHAEECLKLAKETPQIYARQALLELAAEFREVAEELERRALIPPMQSGPRA
jgi:hypothetical protein